MGFCDFQIGFVGFKADCLVMKTCSASVNVNQEKGIMATFIFFMPETKFHNLFPRAQGENSIRPQNVAVVYQNAAKFDQQRHPSLVREAIKTYCRLGPFQMKCSEKHKSPDGFVDCCGLTGGPGAIGAIILIISLRRLGT
jgi:hypothetical protein